MADFIPGEAYRLDVIGADNTVLVDSWSSQIKADVVDRNGNIQVDTVSGKIYGPVVGNIEDIDGTVLFDGSVGILHADVKGDILDTNGNVWIDNLAKTVNGDLLGNVIARDNTIMVDSYNNVIRADSFYGDFHGDLIGNIITSGSITGSFVGDFTGDVTGNLTGDVLGNVNGNVNGNVYGDVTGTVTGQLIGEILADANTSLMAPPNLEHNQWNWLGGINHPVAPADTAIARGPIVVLGDSRDVSALRAHVQHYDGTNVVQLDIQGTSAYKAIFNGKLNGDIADPANNFLIMHNSSTRTTLTNSELFLHAGDNGLIELKTETFVKFFAVTPFHAQEENFTHRGTHESPLAVQPGDIGSSQGAFFWDGNDYRLGGVWGFVAETDSNPTDPFYPTKFGISVSDGTTEPNSTTATRLELNGKGVVSAPVFKPRGTTFAQRDSMIPEEGMIIFNTSSKKFQGYTGTAWVDLH